MGLEKISLSARLHKRSAFSHFLIRDWEASQSKNIFCGEMELFTHILDCEVSQYTQLESVKEPRFTNMWWLFSVYTVQLSMSIGVFLNMHSENGG